MFRKFGEEFLIHSNKDDQYHPSIIKNSNLVSFDVTWTNKAINATSARINLKHYNAARSTNNSNIDTEANLEAVNQDDFATKRMYSKIIYLAHGNQLVTWCSDMQDGSGFGIYASILEHRDSQVKKEFRVNTHVASNQEYPSAAPLANGGFIIVWHSLGQDTKQITSGIFAKIFNDAGEVKKEEFQVNVYTANNQDHPVITVLDNNSYVIAWQSFGQDGSGRGVYAKIYDHNHAIIKEEFRVNSYTLNNQEFPALAKLADNKFIVVWQSNKQDGSGHGIYAKILNSLGDTIKEEFVVNNYTNDHQKYPSVTLLSDESFIITWQSQGQEDNTGYDIYARKYSKEAIALGEEFRVNNYIENNQESPQITALANGSCAIVWQSFGQDGYKYSIYGQMLTNENNTIYETDIYNPKQNTPATTVTPLETITPISDTLLVPTVVSGYSDITTAISTQESTTESSSDAFTQKITTATGEPATTRESTSIADTTAVSHNPQIPTTIVTDYETPISTGQSTLSYPSSKSGEDRSTLTSQLSGSTEAITDTSVAPSSTNVTSDNTTVDATNVEMSAVATSAAPVSTHTSTILLNTSSSSPIYGSEAGNSFIITGNVKEATIIAGSGIDSFSFESSNNAIVYIDNFGNNDVLNFSIITNATSYDALNKTSGSTHFHLPNNQTIVVKNRYPHELNDTNVALKDHLMSDAGSVNFTPSPVIIENSEKERSANNNTSDDSSNTVGFVVLTAVGAVVIAAGALTIGAIIGYMICKYKNAAAAASVKISENLQESNVPFGSENEEASGSKGFSSINIPEHTQANLPGEVTTMD